MKVLRAIVIFFAPFAVSTILNLIAVKISTRSFQSGGGLPDSSPWVVLTQIVGVVIIVGYFAVIASAVDYRPRDALFLLIPIVGLVIAFKWSMRYAVLPERTWPAREDGPAAQAA